MLENILSGQQAKVVGEIQKLKAEEKEIIQKIQTADTSLKDNILKHARVLERLYELGDYPDAISSISSTLRRKYRELNVIGAEHIIDRYLDQKYKDPNYDRSTAAVFNSIQTTEDYYSHLPPGGGNRIEDVSRLAEWEKLSRREKQDLPERLADMEAKQDEVLEQIHRAKIEAEALCTEEKIPFIRKEDENQSTFDAINAQKKDRDPITISRPQAKETVLSEAVERFIRAMVIFKKNIVSFPPDVLEDAEEYAAAFDEITTFFAPMLDLKWRKDNYAWLKIELDRHNFGKHASAVKNYTRTLSCSKCDSEMYRTDKQADRWTCAKCSNNPKLKNKPLNSQPVCKTCKGPITRMEFTGWECPSCHNTKAVRRNLTREQVGDKSPEVVEQAKRMVENIPWFWKLCMWYRNYVEPRAAGRSVKLGPELSNQA